MTAAAGRGAGEQATGLRVVGLGAWCDFVDQQDIRRRAAEVAPLVSPVTSREDAVPGVAPVDVARETADLRRQASFVVHEFADLSDGTRVTLHQKRGFGVSTGGVDPWPFLTRGGLMGDVLTTALPDDTAVDEHSDEHSFEWLAGLCADRSV